MGALLKIEADSEWIECASCGVFFGSHVLRKRRQDHHPFYCPNGHSQHFPQENTEEFLRRKLAESDARLADRDRSIAWERSQRETEAQRAREAEKKLKRIKTRVAAGVCPECNRTFQQLARHMACKHQK